MAADIPDIDDDDSDMQLDMLFEEESYHDSASEALRPLSEKPSQGKLMLLEHHSFKGIGHSPRGQQPMTRSSMVGRGSVVTVGARIGNDIDLMAL